MGGNKNLVGGGGFFQMGERANFRLMVAGTPPILPVGKTLGFSKLSLVVALQPKS